MLPRYVTRKSPGALCLLSLSLVGCGGTIGLPAGPRIYVLTDLEGVSGVYKFAQTRDPESQLTEQARE